MTVTSVIDQLIQDYQLGELISCSDCASYSDTHHLQCLTTTRGRYAIKKLHPVLVQSPDYLLRCRQSLQLAEELYARGLPVNTALKREQQFLFHSQDGYYLVLPWAEGSLLADTDVRAQQVRQIATLLAKIHTVSVACVSMPALNYAPRIKRWQGYREKILRIEPTLASLFEKVWPMLRDLSEQVPMQQGLLQQDRVLSHGDLDPHNVLWRAENDFTVIDWEWGGQVNRTQDCWAVALSWSRVGHLQWDMSRFKTFWQVYHAQSGVIQNPPFFAAYTSLCGYWLEWVDWTIQRALVSAISIGEQQFAYRTLTDILETLHYLHHHYSLFEALVEA